MIVEKSISFDITDYTTSVEESLRVLKKLCKGVHIHIENRERRNVVEVMLSITDACPESKTKNSTIEAIMSLRNTFPYLSDIEFWVEIGRIFKEGPAGLKNSDLPFLDDARQKANDIWCSQEVYDLQEQYIQTIFRLAKE